MFIDGEVGTTGLQVYDRLSIHPNINILKIDRSRRKEISYKKEMLKASDVTFLCLPDNIAIETVAIADELGKNSPILIENKILPKNTPLVINAVSGYSGGGKDLISYFNNELHEPFFNYGLQLNHKHLPEIKFHNGLDVTPIFNPTVGDFIQGMSVCVPIHFQWLSQTIKTSDILTVIKDFYFNSKFIKVLKKNEALSETGYLRPDNLVDTNFLDISVFGNDQNNQAVIIARLDNLGKGASGAAVQCMNIALGYDETLGLK